VNKKMHELHQKSAARDKTKVAILSALNIAGELFDYKAKYEKIESELSTFMSKAGSISRKLDESV
jgi:cell division protein ZapA (FtsZ GTPase activity inhibitor)